MKNWKRILSSVLVFCLLAGFAPSAFAAEDSTELVYADSGESVTVGNVTVTGEGDAASANAYDGGSASLTVEGSVTQTAENASVSPVDVYSSGEGSVAAVNISGDVSGEGVGGTGVSASGSDGGSAQVQVDGKVDVVDATLVQQYAAELIDDFKKTDKPVQPANPVTPTEPEQPTASQDKYTVVFSDTLGWGSPMYCYYYYSDGSYTAAWPGTAMTSIGNNAYSIDVPENAAYIIFTNGTVQTEKIPFDKTVLHYYAVDSVNEKGRYDYASYTN